MAEQIGVLFAMKILGDPRNIVLDGGPDLPMARRRGGEGKRNRCCATFAKLFWPFVKILSLVTLGLRQFYLTHWPESTGAAECFLFDVNQALVLLGWFCECSKVFCVLFCSWG